jgi:hypothetical protein
VTSRGSAAWLEARNIGFLTQIQVVNTSTFARMHAVRLTFSDTRQITDRYVGIHSVANSGSIRSGRATLRSEDAVRLAPVAHRFRFAQVIIVVAAGCLVPFTSSVVGASVAPACQSTSVHVSEYDSWVGAGNVNDLYWIRNVSRQACSVRGYVEISFIGVYGFAEHNLKNAHALSVEVVNSLNGGANGNNSGGVKTGVIPRVTLDPGDLASFWIYGTDEPSHLANGQQTRCISSFRMLVRLPSAHRTDVVASPPHNGFYWCGKVSLHPVIAGDSGTSPPRSLSSYFGSPN